MNVVFGHHPLAGILSLVGPDGMYLNSKHTQKHFKQTWYPDLFERGSYTDWEKKGVLTLLERASARVEKLLAEHQLEPLPKDVQLKLRKIIVERAGEKK
jgi:trimethylamine---corrinoid protein Co-methyltransferase